MWRLKLFTVDGDLLASESLCYLDYSLFLVCWLSQPKKKIILYTELSRGASSFVENRDCNSVGLPINIFQFHYQVWYFLQTNWTVRSPSTKWAIHCWKVITYNFLCHLSDGLVKLLARYLQSCNFFSRLSNQIPFCHSRELLGLEVVHFVRYAKTTLLQ